MVYYGVLVDGGGRQGWWGGGGEDICTVSNFSSILNQGHL